MQNATCSILEQVAKDGKKRKIKYYNLDIIISVGYRVNSKKATQFRKWATQGLKEAHHQLDLSIERCYRKKPFENDEERFEYLFKLYEEMVNNANN
jgi:hypothetical protein